MRAALRQDPRLVGLLVAFACTFVFFLERPSWNQNSRLGLTRAVVERGAIDIGDAHHTTGDKSLRNGRYYCDKAPGASFLAVPAYGVFHAVRAALGLHPPEATVAPLDRLDAFNAPSIDARQPGDRLTYNTAHRVALSVCAFATSGLATLACLLAIWLATAHIYDHGLSRPSPQGSTRLPYSEDARNAGILCALVYGLCTPALPYATAFYGHQPAASALFCAWVLVQFPTGLGPRATGLIAGTACGLAVCAEYPVAVPVLLLTTYAAWARGLQTAVWMGLAGLPWAALLGGYHDAAFGGPLSLGYDHLARSEFAEGMEVRYGIGVPSLHVLWAITFGNFRGLFYASPVLLLAVYGLATRLFLRRADAHPNVDDHRLPWCFLAVVCAYHLLLNAGYYMWNGGAAFGPRHCLPMLPFLMCGLAHQLRHRTTLFWALAAVSLCHAVAAASAGPELPEFEDPIWGAAIPSIARAGIGPGREPPQTLGHLMGLPGWLGLAPIIALWLLLAPWRAGKNDHDPI